MNPNRLVSSVISTCVEFAWSLKGGDVIIKDITSHRDYDLLTETNGTDMFRIPLLMTLVYAIYCTDWDSHFFPREMLERLVTFY